MLVEVVAVDAVGTGKMVLGIVGILERIPAFGAWFCRHLLTLADGARKLRCREMVSGAKGGLETAAPDFDVGGARGFGWSVGWMIKNGPRPVICQSQHGSRRRGLLTEVACCESMGRTGL